MRNIISFVAILMVLISCDKIRTPIPLHTVKVNALSDHRVDTKSYEIPKAIFRGVLWPTIDRQDFTIWIIDRGKEFFLHVPPPPGFATYNKEVTENWQISQSNLSEDKVLYSVQRKDSTKAVKIELPICKREYSFAVLNNDDGEEMVVFMNISEDVVDKGLFGYVKIKEN